jgi:lipid-binding SYLF domain-containing protein
LFAGIDLTGGVLKPDNDDNRDLYGADIKPRDILISKKVTAPQAASSFMAALRRSTTAADSRQ